MKPATEHQKRRARAAANYAFPGAQPCETCGAERGQRHHDDYDRPLKIRWLCDPCHRSEHRPTHVPDPAFAAALDDWARSVKEGRFEVRYSYECCCDECVAANTSAQPEAAA